MPDRKKPSQTIKDKAVKAKSTLLKGKRIACVLTGGIASTEGVKIIREFRRHSAAIFPFMTKDAERFITPLSIEWASGRKLVSQISSDVENLEEYDAVVIAPATLNTISKAALGIADNPVSLLIASQLGNRTPLFFVPTMNVSLSRHPQYSKNRETLISWGVKFHPDALEEDRLKMPDPLLLVSWVIKELK